MAIDKFGDNWTKRTIHENMQKATIDNSKAEVKATKVSTDIMRQSVIANTNIKPSDTSNVQNKPEVQQKPSTVSTQSSHEKTKTGENHKTIEARTGAENAYNAARDGARNLANILKPVNIEQQTKAEQPKQTADPKQAPTAGGKHTVAVNPKAVPTTTLRQAQGTANNENLKNSTQQNQKGADNSKEAKLYENEAKTKANVILTLSEQSESKGKDPLNAGQVASQTAAEMKKGEATEGKESKKDGKKIGRKESAKGGKSKKASGAVYKDETNSTGRLGSLIAGESPFDAEAETATNSAKAESAVAEFEPEKWDSPSVAYNGDPKYEGVRERYLKHIQTTEKVLKEPMNVENWSEKPVGERFDFNEFVKDTEVAVGYAQQIIREWRLPKVAGGWGTRC